MTPTRVGGAMTPMGGPTLKALMVDVDGVVVKPRPGGWGVDMEADLGLPIELLAERFFRLHWSDVELGRAELYDRLAPVLAEIAPHLSCEALTAYWFEKDAGPDEALLADLALARRAGLQLHLATVQEHRRADHLWNGLGLRDRFDAIHYSADLGCKKPQPAFFAAVAQRTGFAPAEMLLIDDRLENVEGARASGWRGALWTGREHLREVLAEHGVAGV